MPPMGSKEKAADLGWWARTKLTRRQRFEGSCWKDKEVVGAGRKALGNSGWRERGNTSNLSRKSNKSVLKQLAGLLGSEIIHKRSNAAQQKVGN